MRVSGRQLRETFGDAVGASLTTVNALVATDTRSLQPGDLFVALIGERFDAHKFVPAALEAGAAGALVAHPIDGVARDHLIIVDDTERALQDLAHDALMSRNIPRAAITGSNGKTTTKELLAAALGEAVHKTFGNLNNHIGVPLTVFALEAHHELAVFEMGMNHLGEIARLTEIVDPSVGIITNIGTAHAGNVGGIDGVAKAKGELFAGMRADAIRVVNLEDARVAALPLRGAHLSYGFDRGEVRCVGHRALDEGGFEITLEHAGARAVGHVPLEGAHNALNATGAVAAAIAMGTSLADATRGLAAVVNVEGRLTKRRAANGALILDDTYNANPDSMRAGLETLRALAGRGETIACLGEMKEVDDEVGAHRALGEWVVELGVHRLYCCGPMGELVRAGAIDAGMDAASVTWASDSAALAASVSVGARDAVLVKGSRAAQMERVVEALMKDEA